MFTKQQEKTLGEKGKPQSKYGDYHIDKSTGEKFSSNGSTVKTNKGRVIYNPSATDFKNFVD